MDHHLLNCVCCDEQVRGNVIGILSAVNYSTDIPTLEFLKLVHAPGSGNTYFDGTRSGKRHCMTETHKISAGVDTRCADLKWDTFSINDLDAFLNVYSPRSQHVSQQVADTLAALEQHVQTQKLVATFNGVKSASKPSAKRVRREAVRTALRRIIEYLEDFDYARLATLPVAASDMLLVYATCSPGFFRAILPPSMAAGIVRHGLNFAYVAAAIVADSRTFANDKQLCQSLEDALDFNTLAADILIEAVALLPTGKYPLRDQHDLDLLLHDAGIYAGILPQSVRVARRL